MTADHLSEEIASEILRYDRRRIGRLRKALPRDFCGEAARSLLALETGGRRVLIVTGFYIRHAGKPETDGPPGALALAQGLERLGCEVGLVTDELCAPMMDQLRDGRSLHVVPVAEDGGTAAASIVAETRPAMLIAVERCGPDAGGRCLQFDGTDITDFTGRAHYLFGHGVPSIGVVDGGNEIGIGGVAATVAALDGLPDSPCVTPTDHVVVGTIANWGCYGILAAMSLLSGKHLLISADEEEELRGRTVAAGAVDGESGEHIPAVDGYAEGLHRLVTERLNRLVDRT